MRFKKIITNLWQRILSSGRFALLTVFAWEMVEEGLESFIAYALSSTLAVFITKALSTLAIISATQGIKVGIKKFLLPYIRTITYKEGNDKVSKIKKFFQWIFANKKTLIGTISALVTSCATAYATYGGYFTFLPELVWLGIDWTTILVAVGSFIFLELGVTGKGFETIATFFNRKAQEDDEKQAKAILKEAKAELKAEQKQAELSQAEKEKADAKLLAEKEKADAKAKAEAEHKAKVEQAKAQLLAEQNKTN